MCSVKGHSGPGLRNTALVVLTKATNNRQLVTSRDQQGPLLFPLKPIQVTV